MTAANALAARTQNDYYLFVILIGISGRTSGATPSAAKLL